VGPAQRGGSGRAHSPLPVDLRVLDLLGAGHAVPLEDPHGDQTGGVPVGALLTGWAHYIADDILPTVYIDEHGTLRRTVPVSAGVRTGDIAGWATWLVRYLPHTVTRPYAAELYEQLQELVARIERLTHTRPRRRLRQAPCPDCSAFALVEQETELHITCDACGHRLTPDEYTAHRDQVMPALTALALRMITPRVTAA
jgi:ribosomal protein S27E